MGGVVDGAAHVVKDGFAAVQGVTILWKTYILTGLQLYVPCPAHITYLDPHMAVPSHQQSHIQGACTEKDTGPLNTTALTIQQHIWM